MSFRYRNWCFDMLQKSLFSWSDKPEASRTITEFDKKPLKSLYMWMGGKLYLRDVILHNIPGRIENYVEPFLGGANLFLGLRTKGIIIENKCILNDLDKDIYSIWRVIQSKEETKNLQSFLSKMSLHSEDLFKWFRSEKDDLDYRFRALRLIYMIYLSPIGRRQSYNKGYGRIRTKYMKIYSIHKNMMKYHNYFSLMNAEIHNEDFRAILTKYDLSRSFIYLDPPYHNTEQYKVGPFRDNDFKDLANLLSKIEGKFILSINDDKFIRNVFNSFKIEPIKTIQCSNSLFVKGNDRERHLKSELLISNCSLNSVQ